ncbi:hypothetical protein M3699_15330 [Peribacillus simplex]|uniref:hypothetical protein n=1 Tax=Peribacillus simplex TaxID=1478 RepID=UPI00203EBDA7|nr:hypothetical protein [Peribacillus simplex]MCM3675212.1 hypothetical protein [Peribacillus simplex]
MDIQKFDTTTILIMYTMVIFTMNMKVTGMNVRFQLEKPTLMNVDLLLAGVTTKIIADMKWYLMVITWII